MNEEEFELKRTTAKIEGQDGEFFGPVNRQTGLPEGTGVFRFGDWIHIVTVKDGEYTDGRRCYINKRFQEVEYVYAKKQSGAKFEKVYRYDFSAQDKSLHRSSGIRKDNKVVKCGLDERLNFNLCEQDWLSPKDDKVVC